MIILDTNIISEMMKAEPHPAVLAWLDAQVAETLYPAIANAHGFAVATRDVAPFRAAGLNVINPWEAIA